MRKPSLFIGSSSEGKEIAHKVGNQIEDVAEVRIWTEGIFNLSHRFFESLISARFHFDYAILILTPDDLIESKGHREQAPRDNVIFECGFFMGHLGKERTFLVYDRDRKPKIPTDLEGVSVASFHGSRHDGNIAAAVRGACDTIRSAIQDLGPLNFPPAAELKLGKDRFIVSHDSQGWSRPVHIRQLNDGISFLLGATELNITYGRVEEIQSDVSTGIVLPANEVFDDDCVNDSRSALGAFVQTHFAGRIGELQEQVRLQLRSAVTTPVEKQPGLLQDSYGVGTCVFIDRPLQSQHRLILAAVTTQRPGIRSEISFLLKALKEIVSITNSNRLSCLHIPLMGAGHGCLRPEVSLFSMILGLSEILKSEGRNLRTINVIVFRDSKSNRPPALSIPVMTQIASSAAGMLS